MMPPSSMVTGRVISSICSMLLMLRPMPARVSGTRHEPFCQLSHMCCGAHTLLHASCSWPALPPLLIKYLLTFSDKHKHSPLTIHPCSHSSPSGRLASQQGRAGQGQ